MKNRMLFLYIIIVFFLLTLCCSKELPVSIGKARQIIVLCNFRPEIEPQIKFILQRNIYTVQPEPEFLIRFEPLSRFSDFSKFHLIFLVGLTQEELIKTLLQQNITKIENDTFGLYTLSNPWAKNQKVLVFVSSDLKYLSAGLERYQARIHKEYQDYILRYLSDMTYARGYQKQISELLAKNYQFSIKVPKGFFLNTKFEQYNFIYLVGHNPTRSIFYYSVPGTIELDPAHIITLRDSLTNLFFDKDFVYQELTYAETTSFNNTNALKITGVWQNQNLIAGGPFIAYCFNQNNRLYYLDGNVFYPGKHKLDNLKQLDAILQTFQTNE